MKLEILFEDKDLVVINKPAGLVVNKADSVTQDTVQSWFFDNFIKSHQFADNHLTLLPDDFDMEYGTAEEIFASRQGIVHRLDKNTSGVLLLAKNPGALVNLLYQFKQRKTTKKYLCLLHGKLGVEKDKIILPIGRSKADPTKFTVIESGRISETDYQVKDFFAQLNIDRLGNTFDDEIMSLQEFKKRAKIYQGFSLVECWPKTGRTHQIRVHMSAIQHPLVGDSKYVGKKRSKLDSLWCKRHFLHASLLEFVHPRSKENMKVEAPLSEDLKKVLKVLS